MDCCVLYDANGGLVDRQGSRCQGEADAVRGVKRGREEE